MTKRICKSFLLFSFLISAVFAQTNTLSRKIEEIISTKKADVGVSIYGLEDKDSFGINVHEHFPMESVFKFHLALAVLNEVDKGRLSLSQKIFIKKDELLPGTWSPLGKEYPNGNIVISLDKIIRYTVAQSDNNGCDILLKLLGGPKAVNNYIHDIGIKDAAIEANEEEMHKAWNVQFTNWTTPEAATKLLRMFYERKILSRKSYDYLWSIMVATSTGNDRIKGQLPPETMVAHKTGTSDTNEQGITAAINDIGIVTLPNGKHFAISVFVSNSKENDETNAKIIAAITKLTWDYYMNMPM